QPRKNPMKSQRFALIFRPVQKKGDNGRLKRRPYEFCLSFFVCNTLQFSPYSLEKIDSLSFLQKAAT
ncbi:MAG: hypothetical protein MSH34_04830, partial [Oscillospiraceae bacterium]|nr:hypothetical protein [Oscillospiraceae bacterium]